MLEINVYKDLLKKEGHGFVGNHKEVGNHKIYFETKSNSDVVNKTFVLSHGACGTTKYLKPLAEQLLRTISNIKVIVIDLPFHGESVATDEVLTDYNVHNYAEVMNKFVTSLQEENVIEGVTHWVGWSMGGSTGLILELMGTKIDELTLLNSSPVWDSVNNLLKFVPGFTKDDEITETFKGVLLSAIQENNTEEFIKAVEDAYLDMSPKGAVMVNDFQAILPEKYNVIPSLEQVKAKTLVISGTKDTVSEIKYQELMADKIPDATLVMLEDTHCMLLIPYAIEAIAESIKVRFE